MLQKSQFGLLLSSMSQELNVTKLENQKAAGI